MSVYCNSVNIFLIINIFSNASCDVEIGVWRNHCLTPGWHVLRHNMLYF